MTPSAPGRAEATTTPSACVSTTTRRARHSHFDATITPHPNTNLYLHSNGNPCNNADEHGSHNAIPETTPRPPAQARSARTRAPSTSRTGILSRSSAPGACRPCRRTAARNQGSIGGRRGQPRRPSPFLPSRSAQRALVSPCLFPDRLRGGCASEENAEAGNGAKSLAEKWWPQRFRVGTSSSCFSATSGACERRRRKRRGLFPSPPPCRGLDTAAEPASPLDRPSQHRILVGVI